MDRVGRLKDKEYEYVYSRAPRLCVDLLIYKFGEILLVRRDIEPHYNYWMLPGGRVLHSETIFDAAIRIGYTELGISIIPYAVAGNIEVIEDGDYVHSFAIGVRAYMDDPDAPIILDEQASAVQFVTTLPENITEVHRRLITQGHALYGFS